MDQCDKCKKLEKEIDLLEREKRSMERELYYLKESSQMILHAAQEVDKQNEELKKMIY